MTVTLEESAKVPARSAGMKITYRSWNGKELFVIATPTPIENQRIILTKGGFKGGVANISRKRKSTVGRPGVRTVGRTIAEMAGSFDTFVHSTEKNIEETRREWRNAWSFDRPGTITVEMGQERTYETKAILVSHSEFEADDDMQEYTGDSLSWESDTGVWLGAAFYHVGKFALAMDGDMEATARLLWDGSATSFKMPNGQTVNLPQIDGPRIIHLDRGLYGLVTREDGVEDRSIWKSFRGQVSGIRLMPHEITYWELGPGLRLETRAQYFTCWR